MQVSGFGSVAEDLAPAGLFFAVFCFDRVENFLELTLNFLIVERFVEQSADSVLGLSAMSISDC